MEHQGHSPNNSQGNSPEEHGHDDGEAAIVKKIEPNEMLSNDMNEHGVIAEHISPGTHPIESGPCYSHLFGMNSKFTTNRGIIKIRGKNFDLVQVLQKH